MVVEFVVSEEEAGQRVDYVVRRHLPDVPRRLLVQCFASGGVRLGGVIVKKGAVVPAGALCRLELWWPELGPSGDPEGLDILWESEAALVVDKPAGLASAALAGSVQDSVANRLLSRFPAMKGIGYSEWDAGLIHRLDTFTSGVLVAAKTRDTFVELTQALRAGRIHKTYLAWATQPPALPEGVIDTWLRADPKNRRRMAPVRPGVSRGRPCETHYAVLGEEDGKVLIRATAGTATRHQVRAHLASLGAPLFGDELYGGALVTGAGPARHALHAESIRYGGGVACAAFECRAPVPSDLSRLTPGLVARLSVSEG